MMTPAELDDLAVAGFVSTEAVADHIEGLLSVLPASASYLVCSQYSFEPRETPTRWTVADSVRAVRDGRWRRGAGPQL
ncbi:hypothetical protein [Nocardioides flavescens]|uniref:Uncharacterized protein n=1 Tax=Nocardioides flavescens TaxID=2691959 RepID=A0A6L7EWD8_9ACTN|nr:hypothetical protein [Nocardioides flavescens]MXG89708.1 hypothetical protein [Nocardioides flavescens]